MKLTIEEFRRVTSGRVTTCLICGQSLVANSMTKHLLSVHSLTPEDYYDTYVEVDTKCYCGNKRKFYKLSKGYNGTCGDPKCVANSLSLGASLGGNICGNSANLLTSSQTYAMNRNKDFKISSNMKRFKNEINMDLYIAKIDEDHIKVGICKCSSKRPNGWEVLKRITLDKEVAIKLEAEMLSSTQEIPNRLIDRGFSEVRSISDLPLIEDILNRSF